MNPIAQDQSTTGWLVWLDHLSDSSHTDYILMSSILQDLQVALDWDSMNQYYGPEQIRNNNEFGNGTGYSFGMGKGKGYGHTEGVGDGGNYRYGSYIGYGDGYD